MIKDTITTVRDLEAVYQAMKNIGALERTSIVDELNRRYSINKKRNYIHPNMAERKFKREKKPITGMNDLVTVALFIIIILVVIFL